MSTGSIVSRGVGVWSVVFLLAAAAFSQPTKPDETPPKSPMPTAKPAVPEKYGDYLKWLAEQKRPAGAISSIHLSGRAGDEWAELTAVVKVQLLRDGEWVRIPLRMPEALLKDNKYTGAGSASYDGFDRNAGYAWQFRGKGEHVLTLTLVVPLKRELPSRRLQLGLPPTAASAIEFSVAQTRLDVTAAGRSIVRTKPQGPRATRIEVLGLSDSVDVQWKSQPANRTRRTRLHVFSAYAVDLREDATTIVVRQRIQATQGSFVQLTARVPAGFEVVDIADATGDTIDSQVDPKQANKHILQVADDPIRTTNIRWTLRPIADPKSPRAIPQLAGIEIETASRETGEVVLRAPRGYRLGGGRVGAAIRCGSKDLKHPDSIAFHRAAQTAALFRVIRSRFQLPLRLTRIPPAFSARPEYRVTTAQGKLIVEGKFHVQLLRGTLRELKIIWPQKFTGDAEGKWSVTTVDSADVAEVLANETIDGATAIRLRVLNPELHTFAVSVRGELKLKEQADDTGWTAAIAFSRPRLEATRESAGTIAVLNKPDRSLEMKDESDKPIPLAGGMPNGTDRVYRVASDLKRLRLSHTRFPQRISTRSVLHLVDDGISNDLRVEQRIAVEIAHIGLEEIRLQVPKNLRERKVRFEFVDPVRKATMVVVGPKWTGIDVGDLQEARFELPAPHLGKLEIIARTTYPIGPKTDRLSLSTANLVAPDGARKDTADNDDRLVVECHSERTWNLEEGDDWRSVSQTPPRREWEATSPTSVIDLRRHRDRVGSLVAADISRARHSIAVDADGSSRILSRFEFPARPIRLGFRIPTGAEQLDVVWKTGTQAFRQSAKVVSSKRGEYELHPLVAGEEATKPDGGVLIIEYRLESPPARFWGSRFHFPLVVFEGPVRVHESLCELLTPADQILLTEPASATSHMHWRWKTPMFTREVAHDSGQAFVSGGNLVSRRTWNRYVFSKFGPMDSMSMTTIRRGALMFIGIGIALVLGLFLVRFPAARSLLTLFAAAIVCALLAMAYPAQATVLSQPILIGVVLAVAAAGLEWLINGRKRAPVLSVGPAHSSASFEFGVAPAWRSTMAQPPATEESEPLTAVPVGSTTTGSP